MLPKPLILHRRHDMRSYISRGKGPGPSSTRRAVAAPTVRRGWGSQSSLSFLTITFKESSTSRLLRAALSAASAFASRDSDVTGQGCGRTRRLTLELYFSTFVFVVFVQCMLMQLGDGPLREAECGFVHPFLGHSHSCLFSCRPSRPYPRHTRASSLITGVFFTSRSLR